MNILDFKEKTLFLLGDLHGDFYKIRELVKRNHSAKPKVKKEEEKKENPTSIDGSCLDSFTLAFDGAFKKARKERSYVSNAVLVVCGDCGIGFNKQAYYSDVLNELQKLLEQDDLTLLFLRGNHDNPEYFETIDGKFNLPNIKFIPDYSVLITKNNISLCVGGGVSQDRTWRWKENQRLNRYKHSTKKVIWWEDEKVREDKELLNEIVKSDLKINSFITHVPAFNLLSKKTVGNVLNEEWLEHDTELSKDIKKEDGILNNIVKTLLENGLEIDWWVCGHLHLGFSNKVSIKYSNKTKDLHLVALNILTDWTDTGDRGFNLFQNHVLTTGVICANTINRHIDELKIKEKAAQQVNKIIVDGTGWTVNTISTTAYNGNAFREQAVADNNMVFNETNEAVAQNIPVEYVNEIDLNDLPIAQEPLYRVREEAEEFPLDDENVLNVNPLEPFVVNGEVNFDLLEEYRELYERTLDLDREENVNMAGNLRANMERDYVENLQNTLDAINANPQMYRINVNHNNLNEGRADIPW